MPKTVGRRAFLRSISLVVTSDCNLRCAYCYQNRSDRRSMDWPVMKMGLDLIVDSPAEAPEISFFGGEPLLVFPLLERAVGYVEERRPPWDPVRYRVTTNGVLMNGEVVAFLERHRVRTSVSFDGLPESQRHRGAGTFDRLDRVVRDVSRNRPDFFENLLTVRVTLSSLNVTHLAATVRYFLSLDIRRIAVTPIFSHDPGWGSKAALKLEQQLADVHDDCIRHYHATGRVPLSVYYHPRNKTAHPKQGLPMCAAGSRDRVVVDVDGEVAGCSTFAKSLQPKPPPLLKAEVENFAIGHITQGDLPERIARYERTFAAAALFQHKERKGSSSRKCATCDVFERCLVCPLSGANIPANRDPDLLPDFQCDFVHATSRAHDRFWHEISNN